MAKAIHRKVTIYVDDKEVKSTLKSLESEYRKLERKQKNLTVGSDEYIAATKKMAELKSVINEQRRAINDMSRAWELSAEKAQSMSTILMGVQSAGQMVSKGYQWMEGFVEQAAQMDDAMAQVAKRTGMSAQEVERLNETFKAMDTRTTREGIVYMIRSRISTGRGNPQLYSYCMRRLNAPCRLTPTAELKSVPVTSTPAKSAPVKSVSATEVAIKEAPASFALAKHALSRIALSKTEFSKQAPEKSALLHSERPNKEPLSHALLNKQPLKLASLKSQLAQYPSNTVSQRFKPASLSGSKVSRRATRRPLTVWKFSIGDNC